MIREKGSTTQGCARWGRLRLGHLLAPLRGWAGEEEEIIRKTMEPERVERHALPRRDSGGQPSAPDPQPDTAPMAGTSCDARAWCGRPLRWPERLMKRCASGP